MRLTDDTTCCQRIDYAIIVAVPFDDDLVVVELFERHVNCHHGQQLTGGLMVEKKGRPVVRVVLAVELAGPVLECNLIHVVVSGGVE